VGEGEGHAASFCLWSLSAFYSEQQKGHKSSKRACNNTNSRPEAKKCAKN